MVTLTPLTLYHAKSLHMKFSQSKDTSDHLNAENVGVSATPKKIAPSTGDHAAGTAKCPIFANKQRITKYAYESNMSITEAGRLHSTTPQP